VLNKIAKIKALVKVSSFKKKINQIIIKNTRNFLSQLDC